MLNAYPVQRAGTCSVLPYREVAELEDARRPAERAELWATVTDAVRAIKAAYRPEGVNVGINLGRPRGRQRQRAPPRPRRAPLDGRHQLHDGASPNTRCCPRPSTPTRAARHAVPPGRRLPDALRRVRWPHRRDPRRAPRGARRHRLRRALPVPRQQPPAHPGRHLPRRRRGCCVVVWLAPRDDDPVLVNEGFSCVGVLLVAVGTFSHHVGLAHERRREARRWWPRTRAVGFPVGHASASWRGAACAAGPTWRILCYSAERARRRRRGFVLVDAVDGHVVEQLVEDNPEDWDDAEYLTCSLGQWRPSRQLPRSARDARAAPAASVADRSALQACRRPSGEGGVASMRSAIAAPSAATPSLSAALATIESTVASSRFGVRQTLGRTSGRGPCLRRPAAAERPERDGEIGRRLAVTRGPRRSAALALSTRWAGSDVVVVVRRR